MPPAPTCAVPMASTLHEEAHRLSAHEVVERLATSSNSGLDPDDVERRRVEHGPNELESAPPVPAWRRFLAQFQDVLVVLLLAATVISTILWALEGTTGLPYEALAILCVVLLNATMGYVQEARAEKAVASLLEMSAATARVVRDGTRHDVAARDLVPGDIILVEEGDTIPADARLLESAALHTAEAALTGESIPVSKQTGPLDGDPSLGDRRNMIFSGTNVTYGHGRAVVTATGMRTEMGRIAGLLGETPHEVTPLQRELDRTGRLLGIVVMVIAVVMIATILLVGNIEGTALFDVLILGVALAVAAVPEGLPAVVTAVLAIGVQRMARRRAIVRRLAAVETLGSASVVASDKTGTLTKNEMTVRAVVTASGRSTFTGIGYGPDGSVEAEDGGPIDDQRRRELEVALAAADRANNAVIEEAQGEWRVHGDPTEAALRVAARKAGLDAHVLDEQLPRVGELPFSSERKQMSTLHLDRSDGSGLVFSKGAADVLLAQCTHEMVGGEPRELTDDRRQAILAASDALALEALRTLGVAVRRVPAREIETHASDDAARFEHDLAFAGLLGMIDPPRPEAKEAVARARAAGLRPLMITGDHPATASVIARELGIAADDRVVTGADLDGMTDDERDRVVADVSVYARVNPEHKLRIVDGLRTHGAVVAMTGDGVNDAPALKKADIGIAMGITGTDVAKEAADMVLADDNFATIVAAVEEGRDIFANIRKFLRYLLSSNVGEVMTMFFGVLLARQIGLDGTGDGPLLPLLATQILWINLVTDGLPALALGLDPPDAGLMQRPPRAPHEGVLTGTMWRGILTVGAIMTAGTLYALDAALPGGFVEGTGELPYGQTIAFTTLTLFQVFNVPNARSDRRSALANLFTNAWLWGALSAAVGLQFLVVYVPVLQQAFGTVPLSAADWIFCTVVASSVLWLRELDKLVFQRS